MPDVAIHSNIARMAAVFAVVQMRHSLIAEATVFSPVLWRLPGEGKESDMPDLLLELRSEEIPARLQRKAAGDLKKLVTDALVEAGLSYEGAREYWTPRRLTLDIRGLTARSADVREEKKGPAPTPTKRRSKASCAAPACLPFPRRRSRATRRRAISTSLSSPSRVAPPKRSSAMSCRASSAISPGRSRCAGAWLPLSRARCAGSGRCNRSSARSALNTKRLSSFRSRSTASSPPT